MSKHTPKPWTYDPVSNYISADKSFSGTPWAVAKVIPWCGDDYEQAVPNGYVMAAAPELLEACKMLMGVAEWAERNRKRSIMDCCDWSVVRAALDKAEGRQ